MRTTGILGTLVLVLASAPTSLAARPNVLVILTDDQGFGDLGRHGNSVLQTPNLDRLAAEGIELNRFHVCPVCSPTRASLFTGRYHPRTGIVDTYLGRSMMFADEVTLAELLRDAGYRTAIFGKWHLGDHFPMRALDQGFGEALVLRGGGLGQPSDPISDRPDQSPYFDPILEHNGRLERRAGYCSDILASAAITFIEQPAATPFFVALTFNCPHTPLEIAERYVEPFRTRDLGPNGFSKSGNPFPEPAAPMRESIARVYGMIQNLDENVGRVLEALERAGKARDTLIVFLTDNGPQQPRYNAGMRDRKGSVFDGGIRVPCFLRWPNGLPADKSVDAVTAHIDLVPTILATCGVPPPRGVQLDGLNLLPLLCGEQTKLPDRTLYFQWHRGDRPVLGRAFAARSPRWKLVQPLGAFIEAARGEQTEGTDRKTPPRLLFDMTADPFERDDVLSDYPEEADKLWRGYRAWFEEVTSARHGAAPRIIVGAKEENPVMLTRQDWRGAEAGWQARATGRWDLEVPSGGSFDVRVYFGPKRAEKEPTNVKRVRLVWERSTEPDGSNPEANGTDGSREWSAPAEEEMSHRFEALKLEEGQGSLWALLEDEQGVYGAYQVELLARGVGRTDDPTNR